MLEDSESLQEVRNLEKKWLQNHDYSIVQYMSYTLGCYLLLYNIVLYHVMLFSLTLYYAVLLCVMLCCYSILLYLSLPPTTKSCPPPPSPM